MPKKGWSLAFKKGGQTHTKGLVNQVGESVTAVPQANPYFLYIVDTVCICKYSFHLYFSICCFFGTLVYFCAHLYIYFTVDYLDYWHCKSITPCTKVLCEGAIVFWYFHRLRFPFSPPPEASRGTCFITQSKMYLSIADLT